MKQGKRWSVYVKGLKLYFNISWVETNPDTYYLSLGSTNYSIGSNDTNATGYVEYAFTPDVTYEAKKQDWGGWIDTQNCQKEDVLLLLRAACPCYYSQ